MLSKCHICRSHKINIFGQWAQLKMVTSDCKPWDSGFSVAHCSDCGNWQKIPDEEYLLQTEKIYKAYQVYYQGEGEEQKVFDPKEGKLFYRSKKILLDLKMQIPEKGKLLDVGCGNGNFLKSFGEYRPVWSLSGLEWDDTNKNQVLGLPGVESFYSGGIEQISEKYDLISLIHFLEHIPDPREFLNKLSEKLKPGGKILVQVPDISRNPFDFLIADHCTHFYPQGFVNMLKNTGFYVENLNWSIKKEMTLILTRQAIDIQVEGINVDCMNMLDWLLWIRKDADKIFGREVAGIFGTSIAAIWLKGELQDKVQFFVDEDQSRVGKNLWGIPVLPPEELTKEMKVYIVMAPQIAEMIKQRLGHICAMFLPPEMKNIQRK